MNAFAPLLGLILLVLAVVRGVGEDMRRQGHLSESTANVVALAFLLDATLVFVAAAGHVAPIDVAQTPALIAGLPLLAGGLILAAAASQALRSRERLLGISIDAVITAGVYGISRHPFYLGSIMALFGAALAGRSWLALALAAVTALVLRAVARNEERVLSERMHDDYAGYRRQTRRLLGRRSGAPSAGRA